MEEDNVLNDLLKQLGVPGSAMNERHAGEAEVELKITEQPKSKGFRFRYNCEGLSHGGLPGEYSQRGKRSFPSVEILNFVGEARIVVSLVTDEPDPKPHAHSLVGRNCSNGICTVQVGPSDMTACFQNMMIQHATKRDVIPILQKRILEHQEIRSMILGPTAEPLMSLAEAEERAKGMAKEMDLSKVRLCCQAYLKDISGRFTNSLPPVLSNVIYDSHSPNSTSLKICRMDKSSGSTRGGEEVYLLCDKVQKEDIEVRFYEMNPAGGVIWEGLGDFGPTDVHRQYAIVFKTPRFRDEKINKPVGVYVQLRRKSDNEVSEPKPFTYHSPIRDAERLSCKRMKRCYPIDSSDDVLRQILCGGVADMLYPLEPPIQMDIQPMVLGNRASSIQQPPVTDASFMPVVTQSQINDSIAGQPQQQQHQQLITQQQISPQNQQLLAQQQNPPHTQGQLTLASHQHLSEPSNSEQLLLIQGRFRTQQQQQQQLQQQRQPGNLDQLQQQPIHSQVDTQQIHTTVQTVQVTQHQQNSQRQHQLQQTVLQQRQHMTTDQQRPQQNGQFQYIQPQKFPGRQQNGITRTVRPVLHRRGVNKVTVKKEPLECRELKENLPEIDNEGALHFPTDIRSDACPLILPINIEADACIDRRPSRKKQERQMIESQERTIAWQKDFGLDVNIDDGQEKEMNKSKTNLDFEDDKEIFTSEVVEKMIQTDSNYEQGVLRLAEQLSEALLLYSQTGDTRVLLQAQKHILCTQDENGDTPLHLAVIHNQSEALQAILSVVVMIEGQKIVSQKNKLDQTPLHLAVITKSSVMVNFLLCSGADPNILDQKGFNSLHLAVDGNFHVGMETLIKSSPGKQGMPTIPADIDALNLDGYSALHMAVQKRDITAAKTLIQSGANKDIPDGKSGRVPLHCAVLAEDFAMLSYLVADAKVSVHTEDFAGNTPLHIASAYDLSAVASLLIAAGANPDLRNGDTENDSDDSCIDEDSDYDDEEDYDDEGERLGSSALDYAKSDQMKRILQGESYMPFVAPSYETKSERTEELLRASFHSNRPTCISPVSSNTDSGVHSEARFKSDALQGRSIRYRGGDNSFLPEKLKRSLMEALDSRHPSANDWQAFAGHLGMGNMINHLKSFDSPTKVLLEQYELMDGTLTELRQVAHGIGRKDIVEILNNALNEFSGN